MNEEEVVHKITDLYDNVGDVQGAIDLLKQYANQRVVKELERQKEKLMKNYLSYETSESERTGLAIASINLSIRIKELK